MKVRWHGYGVRLIGDPHSDGGLLEWSERTGYVQDVADHDLLANLLTYPSEVERFTPDETDEIFGVHGMTEDAAAALALAGAPDLADLARLATDEELRAAVAAAAALDATQVLDWAEQARKLMEV